MEEGDTGLVLSTGTFAKSWGEIAESVGVLVETIDFGMSATVSSSVVGPAPRTPPCHSLCHPRAPHTLSRQKKKRQRRNRVERGEPLLSCGMMPQEYQAAP